MATYLDTRRSTRAAVVGMVFGDAYIGKQGSVGMKHSMLQADYVRHKAMILQKLQHIPVNVKEKKELSNYGVFDSIRLSTQERPLYKRLRKLIYRDGKKTFTRKTLDLLDERGIAIWFMDDGSCTLKQTYQQAIDKTLQACEVTLNTYCSLEENQVIIDYFNEKWDLNWGLNKSKGKWRLRMGTKEGRKLAKLIEPYIVPSMRYKIDPLLRRINGNEIR